MSDLVTYFSEYFNCFVQVIEFVRSVHENSSSLLKPLINQAEQLRLCSRAELDEKCLLKFPDVKERLLVKIILCLEETLNSIIKLLEDLQIQVDRLKVCLNTVEKAYEKFDPDEAREFNPLIPANEKLLELAVDMWKCLYTLWLGENSSVEAADYYNEDSIKAIADSFLKFKKLEQNFKYVVDLTYYLRTLSNSKEPL